MLLVSIMGRKITVILRDGTELTYKNARVVEGNKTWIYQVNKNERPEELLAFIDPYHKESKVPKG